MVSLRLEEENIIKGISHHFRLKRKKLHCKETLRIFSSMKNNKEVIINH